jgi:hypothetical protein
MAHIVGMDADVLAQSGRIADALSAVPGGLAVVEVRDAPL